LGADWASIRGRLADIDRNWLLSDILQTDETEN